MQFFHIVTLGCKVNQYETQSLREAWLEQGLAEIEAPSAADVVVINSCAITAKAVADVRATIRKLHRENPAAPIVVTGCAAEVMGDELRQLAGVFQVISRKEKGLLLKGQTLLAGVEHGEDEAFSLSRPNPLKTMNDSDSVASLTYGTAPATVFTEADVPGKTGKAGVAKADEPVVTGGAGSANGGVLNAVAALPSFPPFAIKGFNRSRAVLKIQDGCSHCCTYCIVPRARGGSVSRPLHEALDEAGRLLEAGFAEIVISGINLRQFQLPASDENAQPDAFWEFITALDERFADRWAGKARFRISSLEPGQLTRYGVEVLGKSQFVAPHLHVSLQSGSDAVLARMGRGHYSVADVREGLSMLSAVWPTFALGADIICGFPGETEAEHAETVALLKEIPLTYAHVFPYSRRPHTLAAKMEKQVKGAIKKQRAAELRAIASLKEQAFIERMMENDVMHVAVERVLSKDGKVHGVNDWYVDCAFVDNSPAVLHDNGEEHQVTEGHLAREHQATFLVQATPVAVEKGRLLVRGVL